MSQLQGVISRIQSADSIVITLRTGSEKSVIVQGIECPACPSHRNPGDPYGFDAREFLRRRILGRKAAVEQTGELPNGRIFGNITCSGRDVAGELLRNGFARLKALREGRTADERRQGLQRLQQEAQSKKLNIWSPVPATGANPSIDFDPTTGKMRSVVETIRGQKVRGCIDWVMSCTFFKVLIRDPTEEGRAFIALPVSLCGVRRQGDEGTNIAKGSLLQRDIEITLYRYDNERHNVLGFIWHQTIADLVKTGLLTLADQSIGYLGEGAKRLRTAQKKAQEARAGYWATAEIPTVSSIEGESVPVSVRQVISGDLMVVELPDGKRVRFSLLNIRAPRMRTQSQRGEPLAWQAREFLRSSVIGKRCTAVFEHERVATMGGEETTIHQGYLIVGGVNPALEMLGQGLTRLSLAGDIRTAAIDDYLAAEREARDLHRGVYAPEEERERISFLNLSTVKNPRTLEDRLRRAGRGRCLVERVFAPGRYRVTFPKENIEMSFSLANCRQICDTPESEVLAHADDILQHNGVEIQVTGMSQRGVPMGVMWFHGKSVALNLIRKGLIRVVRRDAASETLLEAETDAREGNVGLWSSYVEPIEYQPAYESDEEDDHESEPELDEGSLSGEEDDTLAAYISR